ncbi:MAG TPA: hypothetical protein VE732_01300 [Nitrososphaera sp.]|jgi:tetratricopeptide (TPR) repeat protein|nr:hypothetical protein [Nitrososphaera sp.]
MSRQNTQAARLARQTSTKKEPQARASYMTPQMRNQFKELHDEVKGLLKLGHISKSTLDKVVKLNRFLDTNPEAIRRAIEADDKEHEIEIRYLKSRCMAAEIFDQFGLIDEAGEACKEGAEILKQFVLTSNTPCKAPENEKPLLREKIRLCIDYAQMHYYRKHKYAAAKKIVLTCRDLVENKLQDEKKFHCFGTLGQIYYLAAKIHRQQYDYAKAEEYFSLAIENYHRRAELKIRDYKKSLETYPYLIQQETALSSLKSGIALALGIGWLNYSRGHLHQALYNNINPARILLLQAHDELSEAYINLIEAAIKRALSCNDVQSLERAAELAEKSYDTFRKNNHRRYMARAAWEQGLTYFDLGQLSEAEEKAREVQAIAAESSDNRWSCNSLILRSRIERRRGSLNEKARPRKCLEAEKLASMALSIADEHNQIFCKINALITRSVTRIDMGRFKEARQDLENALALNEESSTSKGAKAANPKIEALCYLSLARSYAREREGLKAQEYLLKWNKLEKEVEHEYVRELANTVSKEIADLKTDFVIKAESSLDLNYKCHAKGLRAFLMAQAKVKAHEKQEVARLLGISRQTLFEWEREMTQKDN